MPLLTEMGSPNQNGEHQLSLHVQQRKEEVREEKGQDSGYEDFEEYGEEECVDSDMEGSIMQRGRPKKPKKIPALPQRNDKRASKLLENVMLELQNLDGSRDKEADKISIIQESDPHELYLSSEEDASFSDDYEDSLSDYEIASPDVAEATRESSSRASSRKSQEDTARVVSFTMVGKPQIIDILVPSTSPPRIQNWNSLSQSHETLASFHNTSPTSVSKSRRQPTPLKLYPAIRRMSISSIISSHSPTSSTAAITHPFAASTTDLSDTTTVSNLPPRKSSRLASNLTSLVTSTKHSLQYASHSFLNSDPFATYSTTSTALSPHPNPRNKEEEDTSTPIEPKTPTSTAAAAWKKGFSKTLNKARRPSMPKLSLAYTAGVVTPRNNHSASSSKLNLALPPKELEKEEKLLTEPEEASIPRNSSSSSSPKDTIMEEEEKLPVRYEDIMKGAGEIIKSPVMPSPKERRALVFGRLVRANSTKGRARGA